MPETMSKTRPETIGQQVTAALRDLFRFLHGHVLDDLQELVEKPASWPPTTAAELERGLDILLTGLTTIRTRQAKPGRPRQHGTPPADPPFRRPGHE